MRFEYCFVFERQYTNYELVVDDVVGWKTMVMVQMMMMMMMATTTLVALGSLQADDDDDDDDDDDHRLFRSFHQD